MTKIVLMALVAMAMQVSALPQYGGQHGVQQGIYPQQPNFGVGGHGQQPFPSQQHGYNDGHGGQFDQGHNILGQGGHGQFNGGHGGSDSQHGGHGGFDSQHGGHGGFDGQHGGFDSHHGSHGGHGHGHGGRGHSHGHRY